MSALFTVLTILAIIAAILVTIVVLLQNSKGGGIASNFVAGNQTFGVRQTADILEKITWGLAAAILLFSIVTNFTFGNAGGNSLDVTDDLVNTTEQVETESAPLPEPTEASDSEN